MYKAVHVVSTRQLNHNEKEVEIVQALVQDEAGGEIKHAAGTV